jgi:hypothetical protein
MPSQRTNRRATTLIRAIFTAELCERAIVAHVVIERIDHQRQAKRDNEDQWKLVHLVGKKADEDARAKRADDIGNEIDHRFALAGRRYHTDQ